MVRLDWGRSDGLLAAGVIAAVPGCRVLVLSMFDLDEYVVSALRAGAAGFLSKDVSAEELTAAVRTVHSGDAAVAPRLLTRLIGTFVSGPATAVTSPSLDGLTERETQVLLLIARGRDNVEIAAELNVSMSTVKNYVTRLFAKLDIRDRA